MAYNFMVAAFALLGSPVSHSLSPVLMTTLGLDYHAREIEPVDLAEFMENQAREYSGLNITTPLKEAIIPFMDTISPDAREINSVNCAVNREDSWEGHNTDWVGVLFALDYLGVSASKAIIIGTGPAARAAAFALRSKGKDFLFLSRNPGPNRITLDQLGLGAIEDHDLIINAAPPGVPPLLSEFLGQDNFVLDMNYGERASELRNAMASVSVPYSDGLLVLVGQAAASLVLWLGGEFNCWAEKLVSAARDIGVL